MKSNILSLKAYQPDKSAAVIRLDANEHPCDFSGKFKEEIFIGIDALRFNRYPETDSVALRYAFSHYCGAKVEQIIAGNGSDEIIRLIMESFVAEGDKVVYHDPTFAMYGISSQIVGGNCVKVPPMADFEVDIDCLIKEANNNDAKVIVICNPNNPTGGIISRENIIKVIEQTEGIVVVDEAYYEFYGKSVIDLIDTYDRLIVLRTMSKAFGLAAARIGFGIADLPIMETLFKVKTPYNLNSMSQMLGKIYLDNSDVILKAVEQTKVRRQEMIAALGEFEFLQLFPTESNFVYIKTDKIKEIQDILKDKIEIRFFGNDYFRVSVGSINENDALYGLLRQIK